MFEINLNQNQIKMKYKTNAQTKEKRDQHIPVGEEEQFWYDKILFSETLTNSKICHQKTCESSFKIIHSDEFLQLECFLKHTLKLMAATFIPLLDYGDVLYMNGCSTSLHMLDAT